MNCFRACPNLGTLSPRLSASVSVVRSWLWTFTLKLTLALTVGLPAFLAPTPTRAASSTTPSFHPTDPTNLVAWCIVPFDTVKRGPEARAAMLERLGFTQLAYDWRTEHLPTFDEEVAALARHHVHLRAWWFPATLDQNAQAILACLRRHRLHPDLWVMMGDPAGADGPAKVDAAAQALRPVVQAAAEIGSKVGLYNHGGWFGEPENQLAIRARLAAMGHTNVGLVYNFHHGHDHLDRIPGLLRQMQPHLLAVNLNGMEWDGDRQGRKILPFGSGTYDTAILKLLRDLNYAGPVGILGHTEEDAEVKLRKDLAGLHQVETALDRGTAAPWPKAPGPHSPRMEPGSRPTTPSTSTKLPLLGPDRPGRVFAATTPGTQVWAGLPEFRRPPWTLEAWVRFQSKNDYNIIAASETKASPTHWELYTHAGSGSLALYAPGQLPADTDSGVDVCDGRWHLVAAQFAGTMVRLWIDGRPAREASVTPGVEAIGGGAQFALGRLVEGGLGCDGWLDEVRLSRGIRVLDTGMPATLPADSQTLAHWSFETVDDAGGLAAATTAPAAGESKSLKPAAPTREAGAPAAAGREPAAQVEADWVDNRWQQTEIGPFLASNLRLPDGSVIAKGLTLRLAGDEAAAAAYDLASGALRCAWTGPLIQLDPSRFGLIGTPRPGGTPFLTSPADSVVARQDSFRWRGLRRAGTNVVLEFDLDGRRVKELVRMDRREGRPIVTRCWTGDNGLDDTLWSALTNRYPSTPGGIGRRATAEEVATMALPPAPAGKPLVTRGQRGSDTDLFAVDTLTLPYANPWKALMFASGVDLTSDGTAFVCTIHGDVWRVTGIDDSLRELQWQRYATGLFQPLGLKVRQDQVYVLGRDRITRLVDRDGDGVADEYQSFHDAIETSTGGHDYVTCLEQDQAGHFYYVDPKGLHRVSADGRRSDLLASGFRNPNGMGVSPDGRILTVAPQQGTWTPSSGIWEIHPESTNFWGGFGGPRVTPGRALGYDAPLCWIPHTVDNSSGSQVWIPPGIWGPLGGLPLHLLWGRCGMMLALRDVQGSSVNGAVVPLPAKFLSGPNRGSFHQDALFIAGSTGWQTSAVKDGALHRVRWNGKRWLQPIAWHVQNDGVELSFAEPLRRETAENPGSYAVKRWNYRYASDYGSKDWSLARPGKEGRDEVTIHEARLSLDQKTVRLGLGPMDPAMQMEFKYNLEAEDGKLVKGTLWGSLQTRPGSP